MPGFDNKGPLGSGPLTGKNRGVCRQSEADSADMNGMGRGGGRGNGHCRNLSGGAGRGGGFSRRGRVSAQPQMNQVAPLGSDDGMNRAP